MKRAAVRRAAAAVGLTAAVVAAVIGLSAAPAAAHGVGGRVDLPLPVWQVIWASTCAVGLSFAAVGWLWEQPRLRAASEGRPLPPAVQRLNRPLALAARAAGLFALAVALYAALQGNVNPSVNIAPAALYIVFWVGLSAVSVAVGDLWRALNPVTALAAAAERLGGLVRGGAGWSRPSPDRHWWAAATLLSFAWLELAYFDSGSPRAIGVFLVVYLAVTVLGGAIRGRRWARNADGFGVLFSLLGAVGSLGLDEDGRLRRRWPLSGLAAVPVLPGTAAVVLVALGSTTFDGFTRSSIWLDVISNRRGWELTLANTVGLVFVIGVVCVIYRGAVAVMASVTGDRERDLSDMFVPSLLPIAAAYIVAHYFSYFVIEGQSILAHISDPFGEGWDLFGTATRQIDYTVVSVDTIAWVQTAAIVIGHILGVIVAHDIAVERYPSRLAMRSQYPMLAAMIAYTVIGLLLLFGV